MAGSRSESIIGSVEEFWDIERDHLSSDDNIKLLTAGVKNMLSIAKCARDLFPEKNDPTAYKYLTYQRLVKVLVFVLKGARLIQNAVSKSDSSAIPSAHLSNALKYFQDVLDELKCKLPQEDIVKDTHKIPNSSAIELLLELFYKTLPKVPENICM